MPDRCTPEYERVLAEFGALLPYRRARTLLGTLFPVGDPPAIDTIQRRTVQVGGHQHTDVDRQKHRHDRAGADQDAHFDGVEPKRQRVKRHQEGVEIDIAHAERRGDIQRS